ncbi:hypothetical protein GCM10023332_04520 [Luteimonas vadosa]|uniref:Uncharacterized protein n=1 Tax=Luteimonas vadosa TaxID=1165507 RepID=A0ABP9DPR8_9GAMM
MPVPTDPVRPAACVRHRAPLSARVGSPRARGPRAIEGQSCDHPPAPASGAQHGETMKPLSQRTCQAELASRQAYRGIPLRWPAARVASRNGCLVNAMPSQSALMA